MKILICFLILGVFLQFESSAQCPLPPNSQFKPFSKIEKKSLAHFEWYSATGENPTQGGGHPSHVFERKVTNLGNTTLKYVWEVGRMQNDALPPGRFDPFCYEFGWPNQKDGLFNYGRGNESVGSTVWEGKDEPPKAIKAAFTFNILEGRRVRTVSIQVESAAQATREGRFTYSYVFTNLGEDGAILEWEIKNDPTLIEELAKKDIKPIFVIDRRLNVSFESPLRPFTAFRRINIFSNSRTVAGAGVPMLLPANAF